MAIIKTRKTSEYTQVHNGALQDPNLSAKAKGILAYLMSLPEDWEIHKTELHKHFKDGRDAIISGFNELIDEGYAMERKWRNEKGRFEFEYIVSDIKFTEEEIKEFQGFSPDPEDQNVTVPENPLRKIRNGKTVTENPELQNKHIQKKHIQKKHKQTGRYVGSAPALLDAFAEAFKLTGYARQKLMELVEIHGEILVAEALERAIKAETDRPIGYMKGVLRKWAEAGVSTKEDIAEYEKAFRERQAAEPRRKETKTEDKLPRAVQMQLEREQAKQQPTDGEEQKESLAEKRARIQQKLKKMREALKAKGGA